MLGGASVQNAGFEALPGHFNQKLVGVLSVGVDGPGR